MATRLPISFPSEVEQLRRAVEAQRGLTPSQRILAVLDALAAAEALSLAGGNRAAQLAYHEQCEQEWREIMKEFIARHVGPSSTPAP